MAEAINFVTPVGRIVEGSLFEATTTNAMGQPMVYKTGTNAGQPRMEYYIGLAIPKTDPGVAELFNKLSLAAQQGFPAGEYNKPGFAWKYRDGDVPNAEGQIKEGFAGCYIFKMKSGYAPKVYNGMANNAEITDPNVVKRGYYVRVSGSVGGNGSPAMNPGLFVNLNQVQFVAYGTEINNAPDADQVFGAAPTNLPAGATTAPQAPMAMPGVPGMQPQQPVQQPVYQQQPVQQPVYQQPVQQQPVYQQPVQQQPVYQQPVVPGAPQQPHTAILTPPGMPQR